MAMSRPSEHWQIDKTITECNRHMLLNDDFSDVTFILDYKDEQEQKESVRIPALQTLLLARSPVFAAMFKGDLAEKKDGPVIHINDVEPESFKEMLRFMYTDEVQLNDENVMQVMYAAKKYIVTNLSKKCSEFLQKTVSVDTAPQLLEQSILFDEKDLKAKVLTKIEEEAPTVLSSEEFTTLSKEALREVFQLNLQVSNEMEVFNASIKWAESRCQELKQVMDGANFREVLGDNLFLIRFPTMTIDDINDTIIPTDILTDEEGRQILRYLTERSKAENLPFPIETRFDRTPQALLMPALYEKQIVKLHSHTSGSFHTNLNCTLSRPVQITKVFVQAATNHWIHQNVEITLTQNGETLVNYDEQHELDGTITLHFAIEVKDVCVEAGELQVYIKLGLFNPLQFMQIIELHTSPQTLKKLSDNFVSIEFTPLGTNLLLGFEYSPSPII